MSVPDGQMPGGLTVRQLRVDDAHRLGDLMHEAYGGGVEDQGQPLQWHLANAIEVLSGQASYGAPIWAASLGAFDGATLVGATVVTDDIEISETSSPSPWSHRTTRGKALDAS